jgi:hypothetical protein
MVIVIACIVVIVFGFFFSLPAMSLKMEGMIKKTKLKKNGEEITEEICKQYEPREEDRLLMIFGLIAMVLALVVLVVFIVRR